MSSYYQTGSQRSVEVQRLFARIASRYDLINDLQSFGFHRMWKHRVVHLARVGPGSDALDLCCGTGDLAFRLSASGATVVGADFSSAMIDVANRRKAEKRGVQLPTFIIADALSLPFDDSMFDVVTVGYGLRNLSDFKLGIAEMQRVLRPGGRLVILDCGKPDSMRLRKLYFAYLRRVVPWFGQLFCGDRSAYAYLLESLEQYPAQRGVDEMMKEAGFVETRIEPLLGGIMSINFGMTRRAS